MKRYGSFIIVLIIWSTLMSYVACAESSISIPMIANRETWIRKDDLDSEISIQKIGLNFQTKGNYGPFYAEIIQPYEIIISEEFEGVLREEKNLYLEIKGLHFSDFIVVDQLEGDLQYDYSVTDDGLLKITVLNESTIPAKLRIHQIAIDMEGYRLDATKEMTKLIYSYPLVIATDKELENNMFATEEDYFICSNFVMQQEIHLETEWYPDLFTKIVVAETYIDKRNQKYFLDNCCYMKNGYLMIPVKEGLKIITGLNTTWDSSRSEAVIKYGGTDEVHIPLGKNWMVINGQKKQLVTETESANGVLYMSFRDMMNWLTNEDKNMELYWSEKYHAASYRINLLYKEDENMTNATMRL